MRRLLRPALIALTAAIFVAGAFARVTLALAPGEPCHTHHSGAHSEHALAGHDARVEHGQHRPTDQSAPTADACFKCCGICTAAPVLPSATLRDDIGLIIYRVVYFVPAKAYAERPLFIDPGIPKRIA